MLENRLRRHLKQIMRDNQMTYSEIAEVLEISQSSVKRAMTRKKMTINDFERYCKAVGFDAFSIISGAYEQGQVLDELSEEQEAFLCRNPIHDYVFIKMNIGFTRDDLKRELGLNPLDLSRILAKIERYGLIKVTKKGKIVLLKRGPFRWIKGGPFEKAFGRLLPKIVLEELLRRINSNENLDFMKSFELYLTTATKEIFEAEVDELIKKYKRKSQIEVRTLNIENLKPYSFSLSFQEFDAWKAVYDKRKTDKTN